MSHATSKNISLKFEISTNISIKIFIYSFPFNLVITFLVIYYINPSTVLVFILIVYLEIGALCICVIYATQFQVYVSF